MERKDIEFQCFIFPRMIAIGRDYFFFCFIEKKNLHSHLAMCQPGRMLCANPKPRNIFSFFMIVAVIKKHRNLSSRLFSPSANLMTRFFTIKINAREIVFDLN